MSWLKRLFGGGAPAAEPASDERRRDPKRLDFPVPSLVLRKDTTLPIVDWEAMDAHVPETKDEAVLDQFWTACAQNWLHALRRDLGSQYSLRESDCFLLLSPFDADAAKPVLSYVERSRRRILQALDGIAKDTETGKVCLLIFSDQDSYYRYVSNYYPPSGEFSLSGGMFLQHGYGHFVFVADEMRAIEPVIAHELTHCLVQHLPLPAWLNEGIAVNTEDYLCPRPPGLFTPEQMHEKHLAFWNEATIQEFWSGKSWLRPDEANMLSYDLARHFVNLTSTESEDFRAFANEANWNDGGAAAAEKHLGFPIAHLAEAVLGEGDWQPKPDAWKQGVEKGQFNTLPPSSFRLPPILKKRSSDISLPSQGARREFEVHVTEPPSARSDAANLAGTAGGWGWGFTRLTPCRFRRIR